MKTKILSILLAAILCLSGCNLMPDRLYSTDEAKAQKRLENILEAIENKDKSKLKGLFSNKALKKADNFDKNANELFKFFKGDVIEVDNWGGSFVEDTIEEDYEIKLFESMYEIKTSENDYRLYIIDYYVNTKNPNNEGIYSLYITLAGNSNPETPYCGTSGNNAGIAIEYLPPVSVVTDETYFNDYSIKNDKVYFDCHVVLKNSSGTEEAVLLTGYYNEEQLELLTDSKIKAIDKNGKEKVFSVSANTTKAFDVTFVGDLYKKQAKQNRLPPLIVIEMAE